MGVNLNTSDSSLILDKLKEQLDEGIKWEDSFIENFADAINVKNDEELVKLFAGTSIG
jgi:hypothetical protein